MTSTIDMMREPPATAFAFSINAAPAFVPPLIASAVLMGGTSPRQVTIAALALTLAALTQDRFSQTFNYRAWFDRDRELVFSAVTGLVGVVQGAGLAAAVEKISDASNLDTAMGLAAANMPLIAMVLLSREHARSGYQPSDRRKGFAACLFAGLVASAMTYGATPQRPQASQKQIVQQEFAPPPSGLRWAPAVRF